ncbi:MAG: hypothetical protein H6662_04500 [Ardenticatenaceae bacterium]|nr:hypothetical protein [Ardenticatenaceae bacterium]MCB9002757.1 hypothetical protein [Ardenticatenaceae bacterium]
MKNALEKKMNHINRRYIFLALIIFLLLTLTIFWRSQQNAVKDSADDNGSLATLTIEGVAQINSAPTLTATAMALNPVTRTPAPSTPLATVTRTSLRQLEAYSLAPEVQLTPFVRPSDTPRPFVTPEVALICQEGDEYTHCEDLVLGIEFEYPSQWGELTSRLREGGEAGYAYEYSFDNGPVLAGGRSRDFVESRGKILTDFTGFTTSSAGGSICTWPYKELNLICETITHNVVFLVYLPDAAMICSEYSGYDAMVVVALNIPFNDFINGFIFTMNALSQERRGELFDILDAREGETGTVCDEANRDAYDQRMSEIAQELRDGLIAGEPDPMLEPLLRLAESVVFK